ncbi:amidohydrolase family protein [Pseudidiomarina halophila]|uniref:amidohydrolase family protein n=1 Tax=Pseudidiomarina halophila TaxID=1449799 RepID=UPI00361F2509
MGHLPGYHWSTGKTAAAYRLTEEVAAQAAAKGIHVIPTAGVVNLFSDLSPAQRQQVQALQRENLRRLRQAGVSFLTGSDQFMGSVVDELIYLREILGFDAQALINSATRTTPQALFPGRKVGKLEIGFEASFNVYQTNPVTDFSNLSAPAQVVQQGAEVIIQPEQPN